MKPTKPAKIRPFHVLDFVNGKPKIACGARKTKRTLTASRLAVQVLGASHEAINGLCYACLHIAMDSCASS